MKKEHRSIIILEFIVLLLLAVSFYFMFSRGVRWQNVQFAAFLIVAAYAPLLYLEAKKRKISIINAKSVILLSMIFWIFLDPLTMREGMEQYEPIAFFKVFMMIILFLVMLYVGYLIRWPEYSVRLCRKLDYPEVDGDKLFKVTLGCFLVGLYIPMILWGGGIDRIIYVLTHAGRWDSVVGAAGRWSKWTGYLKNVVGYFRTLGLHLFWFGSFFSKKKSRILLLSSLLLLWIIFDGGTRSAFAAAAIPLFLLYYFKNYFRGKLNNKRYVYMAIGMFLLVSLMQFQLYIRDSGHGESNIDVIKENYENVFESSPTEYHRDDQFNQMLKYVTYVPERISHSGEWLILRPLYHWIPRAAWPGKPEGITAFFEYQTNSAGVGMTTWAGSIIGDFYLAQGWFGVILAGLLMGFLAHQFDLLIGMASRAPAVLLLYAYGLMFLIVSIRSFTIIYAGWFVFIAFYFLLRYVVKKDIVKNGS